MCSIRHCGQSRTKPGLSEVCKFCIPRIKPPEIRESAPDSDNSIRTIADSRRGTTFWSGRQPATSILKRSRRPGSSILCPGQAAGAGVGGLPPLRPGDVTVPVTDQELQIAHRSGSGGGVAVDRGGRGGDDGRHPAVLRRDEDIERPGHVRLVRGERALSPTGARTGWPPKMPSAPGKGSHLMVLPLRPDGPSRLREQVEVGGAPLNEGHLARRCSIFSRPARQRTQSLRSPQSP